MEGASTAWSIEIQDPPEPLGQHTDARQEAEEEDGTSAVTVFEQTIKDPKRDTTIAHPSASGNGTKIEVETSDMQGFLTQQLDMLEQLKVKDEKDRANEPVPTLEMSPMDDQGRVNEHIGPVQFNMGGIQVDADDMLKKLRVSSQHSPHSHQKKHTNVLIGPRSQPRATERERSKPRRREGPQPSPGKLLRRSRQETRQQSSWKPFPVVFFLRLEYSLGCILVLQAYILCVFMRWSGLGASALVTA